MTSWIDIICEVAADRLRENKILYLSQIPKLLESRGIDWRANLSGRSLREALQIDAKEKLLLITKPDKPLEWAVLPKVDTSLLDIPTIFGGSQKEQPHLPKFQSWFWGAFIKDITHGKKRYIRTSRFVDIPEDEHPLPGSIEILNAEMAKAKPGEVVDSERIYQLITAWAARTGKNLERYHVGTERRFEKSASKIPLSLDEFDDDDLRRILVPMDIVLKILRNK